MKTAVVVGGVVGVVLLVSCFLVLGGALLACENGGGRLGGLTCYDLEVVGACESLAGGVFVIEGEIDYFSEVNLTW